MYLWGLIVNEMLYIECGGVPIMFPDEFLTYKVPKKANSVLTCEDDSAATPSDKGKS